MTNAAALAQAFFRPTTALARVPYWNLTETNGRLLPEGPIRDASTEVYAAFFLGSIPAEQGLLPARFCENHLRNTGDPNGADRMAAVRLLLSWRLTWGLLQGLQDEGIVLLSDPDGVPVQLARRARPRFGLPILRDAAGSPQVGAALKLLRATQARFLARDHVCPACFRTDEDHDGRCPAHVPVDPRASTVDLQEPP